MLLGASLLLVAVEEGLGREILGEHGAAQAERLDLVARNVVVEGHAAGVLDDQAEQQEVGGAHADLGARLEERRLVSHQREQVQRLVAVVCLETWSGAVIGNTGGVLQQFEDRGLAPGGGQVREVFVDRVADVELASLVELEHRHRGETLGHQADVPHRSGRGELVVGHARAAVARGARNVGGLHNRHGEARHIVLVHELRDPLVDVFSANREGCFPSRHLRSSIARLSEA